MEGSDRGRHREPGEERRRSRSGRSRRYLGKLFSKEHLLVPVPQESITQLLAFDVHVQSGVAIVFVFETTFVFVPDGNQHFRLGRILVHSAGVGVIEAEREGAHLDLYCISVLVFGVPSYGAPYSC